MHRGFSCERFLCKCVILEKKGGKSMTNICPVEYVVDMISGKWKVLILWSLNKTPKRFGQLEKGMKGISKKVLSQHLKELEKGGLLSREVLLTVPVSVEYSLTEKGKELLVILEAINNFGNTLIAEQDVI
jgi:DNA-binding HxlR family transcriptional regulator